MTRWLNHFIWSSNDNGLGRSDAAMKNSKSSDEAATRRLPILMFQVTFDCSHLFFFWIVHNLQVNVSHLLQQKWMLFFYERRSATYQECSDFLSTQMNSTRTSNTSMTKFAVWSYGKLLRQKKKIYIYIYMWLDLGKGTLWASKQKSSYCY